MKQTLEANLNNMMADYNMLMGKLDNYQTYMLKEIMKEA
jgi:hypothetical protein